MLKIKIPSTELFNEKTNEFINTKEYELQLEHSLVSISKWESKWHKPFLTKGDKTLEETIDYIRFMTITQNVDPMVYEVIPKSVIDEVTDYIYAPMTATTIRKENAKINRDIITSEIIYYWMITFQINWEAQKWHLNRLLTLINVCSEKNNPPKKLTKAEARRRQNALNEQRKAQYKTTG